MNNLQKKTINLKIRYLEEKVRDKVRKKAEITLLRLPCLAYGNVHILQSSVSIYERR